MSKSILVVDDEETIREMLSEFLTSCGYKVFEAEDGEDALQKFGVAAIDLVLSDIRMPKMSGLMLLKAIKKINRNLPVVLMTGYELSKNDISNLSVKAEAYVSKPFSMDSIKKLVEGLLNK